jgi:Raf kinase inhibitor-like YbhB/YbcL family protein
MADRPPMPYDSLPPLPSFTVTSDDVAEGEAMAKPHCSGVFGAGGEDVSPHLRWEGFPPETKSFAVTCFDPDAPTGSGFWHWVVLGLPASVTELPRGCGTQDGSQLPGGAIQLRNDAGLPGYIGAAPPEGHGPHRYVFTLFAVKQDALPVNADTSAAIVGFQLHFNTIEKATLTGKFAR